RQARRRGRDGQRMQRDGVEERESGEGQGVRADREGLERYAGQWPSQRDAGDRRADAC
ncbi:unnamed protein product, partial [Closterium sp. Naga37s-1]